MHHLHFRAGRNSGQHHGARLILLMLALLLTLAAQAAPRYWSRFGGTLPIPAEGLLGADSATSLVLPLDSAIRGFELTMAFENLHADPLKSYRTLINGIPGRTNYPSWGIAMKDSAGGEVRLSFTPDLIPGPINDTSSTLVTISDESGTGSVLRPADFNHNSARNIIRIAVADSLWTLSCGKDTPAAVLASGKLDNTPATLELFTDPGALVRIIHLRLEETMATVSLPAIDPWELTADYFALRPDPREGFWAPAERDFDEDLIRLGGDYIFALLSNDSGGYALYYISGARSKADAWIPGMMKVNLAPSVIPGRYDVEWFDADFLPLSKDIIASFDDSGRLVISFPYQNSTLTLQRIPTPGK